MTSEIKLFNYGDNAVRTIEKDGEVWFVAKDVCDVLELSNPTEALRALDDDEKNNRGPIVGAYAIVYRTDRKHPVYVFAPFNEYNKNNSVWRQYPSAMILKVAESMALKRAFSISGLVTEEEIGTPQEQKQQEQRAQPQPQSQVKPTVEAQNTERKTQINQVYQRYLAVCDGQKNHVFNAMKKITGKDHSEDYTSEDIKALFADVIKREDEKMNKELEVQQTAGDVDPVIDVPVNDTFDEDFINATDEGNNRQ